MHSYVLCQNGNELAFVVKRTVDNFVNYIMTKRYYIFKRLWLCLMCTIPACFIVLALYKQHSIRFIDIWHQI